MITEFFSNTSEMQEVEYNQSMAGDTMKYRIPVESSYIASFPAAYSKKIVSEERTPRSMTQRRSSKRLRFINKALIYP